MKYLLSILSLSFLLFSCTEVAVYDETEESAITGKYNTMKVVDDFIYAITDTELITIDRTDSQNLQEIDKHELGGRLENLYVVDGAIFIGSETDMHIFTIQSNGIPSIQSSTQHIEFGDTPVRFCDPVVASQDIAYVTLTTETTAPGGCGTQEVNSLLIYDVHDKTAPILKNELNLDSPQGLAIHGDLLFVTNLNTGTHIYRVDHHGGLTNENFIAGGAQDVVAVGNKLMIVSSTEINQYDITDVKDIIHYGSIDL